MLILLHLDQRNADLVSRKDFFKKTIKILLFKSFWPVVYMMKSAHYAHQQASTVCFCYLQDPLQLFFTGVEQGSLWVLKKPRERCRHPGQKQRRGPWYLPSQAGSDPTFPPALSRRFRGESGFSENKSRISVSFVFVVSCLVSVWRELLGQWEDIDSCCFCW